MDLAEILKHFSVPRPNQSEMLAQTSSFIKELLTSWGIPFVVQEFTLRPFMQLTMGVCVVLLAVFFFICMYKRWPIAALLAALAIPALLFAEFEGFITVATGIFSKTGQNIIINYTVPDPARELIFSAHYDTKTDFFDHIQRSRIYMFIPLAFVSALALAIFTFFSRRKESLRKKAVTWTSLILSGLLVVYWGLVFLGFGGYIFLPADRQSYGSADDGGSVAALLVLAKDIKDGKVNTGNSNVTILLTSGEEVNLQGADRYVSDRFGQGRKPSLPVSLVNLELVGQNGTMVYWKKDGEFIIFYDASPDLVSRLGSAWNAESGQRMEAHDRITDDAQRFLSAGVPSITVGNSGLPGLGEAGFHSTMDNRERVSADNVMLVAGALKRYIEGYNTR